MFRHIERKSGIEMLKIFGIILIIINHVTMTLGTENDYMNFKDYVIPLGEVSNTVQIILLTLLRQTGTLGNNIFFACSAWFLVGKKSCSTKKAFNLLSTAWSISFIYLFIWD